MKKFLIILSTISSLSFACESKDMAMKKFDDKGLKATLTILSDYLIKEKGRGELGSKIEDSTQANISFIKEANHLIKEHKSELSKEEKDRIKKILNNYYTILGRYYNDLVESK